MSFQVDYDKRLISDKKGQSETDLIERVFGGDKGKQGLFLTKIGHVSVTY